MNVVSPVNKDPLDFDMVILLLGGQKNCKCTCTSIQIMVTSDDDQAIKFGLWECFLSLNHKQQRHPRKVGQHQ